VLQETTSLPGPALPTLWHLMSSIGTLSEKTKADPVFCLNVPHSLDWCRCKFLWHLSLMDKWPIGFPTAEWQTFMPACLFFYSCPHLCHDVFETRFKRLPKKPRRLETLLCNFCQSFQALMRYLHVKLHPKGKQQSRRSRFGDILRTSDNTPGNGQQI